MSPKKSAHASVPASDTHIHGHSHRLEVKGKHFVDWTATDEGPLAALEITKDKLEAAGFKVRIGDRTDEITASRARGDRPAPVNRPPAPRAVMKSPPLPWPLGPRR